MGARTGQAQSGLCIPSPLARGTLTLSPRLSCGHCHQVPVPGEQRAPWRAPWQQRQVPFTTEVAAGAIFGAVWWGSFLLAVAGNQSLGQGKSRTEAGPTFFLHQPWHREATQIPGGPGTTRASTLNPELSRPSPELLRSHFARYRPLPCHLLWGTPHPFLPLGATAFALESVPSK